MISPSVRSTRRSTPCVLGCCGPMLTSNSSVRTSNSTTVGSCGGVAVAIWLLPNVLGTQRLRAVPHREDVNGVASVTVKDSVRTVEDFPDPMGREVFHAGTQLREVLQSLDRRPQPAHERPGRARRFPGDVLPDFADVCLGLRRPDDSDSGHSSARSWAKNSS